MSSYPRLRQGVTALASALLPWSLLMGQACIPAGTTGGVPSVVLRFPNLDRSVAVGEQVTLVYDALNATSVRAFYDRDGSAGSGDEVIFSANLPSGSNQVAQMATASLPTGLYYLGITASNSAGSTTGYASGRMTLVSSASIVFLSPVQDLNVGPGVTVPIRFDAGVTDFTYQVLRDPDSVLNGNETALASGPSGGTSTMKTSFDTTGLSSGSYYIGVTVTTAVGSTTTEYAPGKVTLVSGVYVQVLAPTVGLRATVGDIVQIVVAANDPSNPNVTVRAFYDVDRTLGNGNEADIGLFPASAGGIMWNTTGVLPGSYYVGAELQNGQVPPAVSYSAGPVELVDAGGGGGGALSFLVSTPSSDVRLLAGEEFLIRWYADVSLSEGTVTLLRDADANDDGVPDGSPVQIATGLNPTLREYAFTTQGLMGAHFIVGRLTMPDATVLESTSRGRLIVRPPYFWTGAMGATGFAGCTLRGFNFQDLAGSSVLPTGDVDGDNVDDFMVISAFGKPGLVNPAGVGYGEAYLIFGNRIRLTGEYDLNRTGSKPSATAQPVGGSSTDGIDQGVIFSGVAVPAGSTHTSGIVAASLAPDMEGDGNNEIIFAIPQADSVRLMQQNIGLLLYEGDLEGPQQFLRGGIVVVASTNSLLSRRNALSRDKNRVIRLQEVGQVYDDGCHPTAVECDIDPPCVGVEPCFGQAVKDTNDDGKCDDYDYTAWWPGGFEQPPFVDPPLVEPMWALCPVYTLPTVTGMVRGAPDLEPYGCRILGQALEDGTMPDSLFGTAVSTIRSDSGYHQMLIAAPNQTARMLDIPELSADRTKSGVVYSLSEVNYWDRGDTTPISVSRPHQYIIGTGGYWTGYVHPYGTAYDLIRLPFYIVGPTANARISNVVSLPDFNLDGRMDFAIGSPNESGGDGAVYIVFRRAMELEGNYLLEKLALPPSDPERLYGVMIRGETGDRMGEVISGGGDFNGDGQPDVLIGLPNHRSGRGAALIVFARPDLVSPANGFTVDDLVAQGYGALLVGENAGDLAGFNVTSAGDFDGDNRDDLLVSAPMASPMFDSNGDGVKDAIGLDYDGNGAADDLTNAGVPTDLTHAGLVYLVKGSNTLIGEINLKLIGTSDLQGMVFVGQAKDDNLGGGTSALGLGARSRGLSAAGDVDKDGRSDILIGSMLADPGGKTNAGECYLIYGGVQP